MQIPDDHERDLDLAELGDGLSALRLCEASSLEAMRRSLARHGQLDALSVFPAAGQLEILDGFKRVRAARALGWRTLRARIADVDRTEAKILLVARHDRRGLTELEEAWLIRSLHRDDGLSQPTIAARLGRHKSWVFRRLMLVEALDPAVQADVRLGLLAPRTAMAVSQLPRGNQQGLAAVVIRRGLTVRQTELDVAELAARIPDGHVGVWGSKELREIRGAAITPFAVRMVEGQPVVTSLLGGASVASAGVAVGDVVVAVDGEPIAARMARLEKYVAASNETWRAYHAARFALAGAEGSSARLTLRGAGGVTRDVTVPRTMSWALPERTGPVYRLLDDGIGYADLDRLENADVDAMFTAFAKTRAIVFDMRGYPHGTAWTIAPRLNVLHARSGPQFFAPLVTVGSAASSFFKQGIGSTDKPLYRGKTVMLIDERTMSQAEHTGLFFEAAAGTTFIGSQTAGANGDVTNLALPGGLFVSFSGHDVRHADGRQLQRLGLVPDVEVRPTIEGLRAGRDEVLERAIAFLAAVR